MAPKTPPTQESASRVPCSWICWSGVRASSAAEPTSCQRSFGRFLRCGSFAMPFSVGRRPQATTASETVDPAPRPWDSAEPIRGKHDQTSLDGDLLRDSGFCDDRFWCRALHLPAEGTERPAAGEGRVRVLPL